MSAPDHPHASAYYGLAAIALAAVLLLMALPAFHLMSWLDVTGYRGWTPSDLRLAAYGGYIGAGIVELLAVMGVCTGVRGSIVASRTGEPPILGTVGVCLNLFAAAVWIGCGFAWHGQAHGFIK